MKIITAIGIDLAKSVFQVCAVNRAEKTVYNKKVSRKQLIILMEQTPKTEIFMEACGSSHYWARVFSAMGHKVKLIAGQYVKRFVTGNKSDAIDAKAIVTCGLRDSTRFVPVKSNEQLNEQAIHRVRSRLVKARTALCNEMRGLLYEQGIIIPEGRRKLEKEISHLLREDELEMKLAFLIGELFSEYLEMCQKIAKYEARIAKSFDEDPRKKELLKVPGIGPITASALLTECDHVSEFKNGRQMAAFLGIVPRHSGSGGKNINGAISKRGDSYIRTLLIHGARSVLRFTGQRDDKLSRWCEKLKSRMCMNKVSVALANKNARIVWKILSGAQYQPNFAV